MIDMDGFYSDHPEDDHQALNAKTEGEGIPTRDDTVLRSLSTTIEIDRERRHNVSIALEVQKDISHEAASMLSDRTTTPAELSCGQFEEPPSHPSELDANASNIDVGAIEAILPPDAGTSTPNDSLPTPPTTTKTSQANVSTDEGTKSLANADVAILLADNEASLAANILSVKPAKEATDLTPAIVNAKTLGEVSETSP